MGGITGPPAGSAGTDAIVAGPAGDIWFTSGAYIGSMTPRGRTADPTCLFGSSCGLPVASLAEGPEGGLWFGGGVPITEGGGGTALLALNAPGTVGRFVPPPALVAIGPNARSVSGRRTDIALSCEDAVAGESCDGVLQLVKRVHVRGSRHARKRILAHRRCELLTGESTRLPLALSRRAMRLLALRGSLAVRATVTVHGYVETTQQIVLHRRGARASPTLVAAVLFDGFPYPVGVVVETGFVERLRADLFAGLSNDFVFGERADEVGDGSWRFPDSPTHSRYCQRGVAFQAAQQVEPAFVFDDRFGEGAHLPLLRPIARSVGGVTRRPPGVRRRGSPHVSVPRRRLHT